MKNNFTLPKSNAKHPHNTQSNEINSIYLLRSRIESIFRRFFVFLLRFVQWFDVVVIHLYRRISLFLHETKTHTDRRKTTKFSYSDSLSSNSTTSVYCVVEENLSIDKKCRRARLAKSYDRRTYTLTHTQTRLHNKTMEPFNGMMKTTSHRHSHVVTGFHLWCSIHLECR